MRDCQKMRDELFLEYDTGSLTTIEVIEIEDNNFSQHTQSAKNKYNVSYNAFHFLFKAILPTTMAISIQPISFDSSLKETVAKGWCVLVFGFNTIMLVLASLHAYLMFPDTASCISFYIFSVFSYLTTVIVAWKRDKIYSATNTIAELSARLGVTKIGSETIRLQFAACLITSCVYLGIYTKFFFYEEWDQYLEIFRVPPFGMSLHSYIWTAVFSVVYCTIVNFSNCLLTVLLLCNVFLSVSSLIQAYADNIERHKSYRSDCESMKWCLVLFREISSCVQDMDEAVNPCTFFILGAVTGSFFSAVSIAFSSSPRFHSAVARIFVSFTLVGCPAIFFVLTTAGNRTVIGYKNLKCVLLEWSEKMHRYSADPVVVRLYALLADNVRKANLSFTGCQMFVINKSLMLTVGSTVITYSFLLFQINGSQD